MAGYKDRILHHKSDIPEDAPSAVKRAYRTKMSINDIRAAAWNAVQGNTESYKKLAQENKRLAKIANQRMRDLKKAGLDMFAYDRAITYLSNRGLKTFPSKLSYNYTEMVTQLSELTTFINQYTSTVSGAKYAADKKIQAISDATGHEYTDRQKYNLSRLLGTDSISTLLRDVRGDSSDVIEVLEELSLDELKEENKSQITQVIDRYLEGWQPFDDVPWATKSNGMNYDELMDELRDLIRH